MANISAIKLPSNITYDLKDKNALEKEYTEVVYADERDSGYITWRTIPDGASLYVECGSNGYLSITPSGIWMGNQVTNSKSSLSINSNGIHLEHNGKDIYLPSNVTGTLTIGTGTSGYLTKWNGTNSLTNGPQLGSSTTTFLRNDGSWATPVNTDTKVNMVERGSTKAYLLGSTTAPTASAQAVTSVAETGVYLETSNSATRLIAPTFVGALTGTASGNLTSSSTLNAAKLSGAIPSAVTATTQASTDNSTKIATTAYVTTAIANLPEPMIFKGSVGTNGTITSLPTAAASNEGWTYKVITALSSPAAKVGDTVISNGSSWVVIPSGDEPSGTVTSITLKAGDGIALDIDNTAITTSGSRTISHADTSSQSSSSNSGRTYIQSITLDTYGHVTGLSTATETVTNTDEKLKVAEVTSATQYYPIVGTGATAATRQYDTTGFKYKGTTGTTSAVGSAIVELGNSTASGTAGNKQGQLIMYGTNTKKATITLAAPSADIALALPTSGGTLALTSQIPTVPTSTGSATTGISIAAHGTGTVIGVQSTTTTASKVTLGTAISVPNVTGNTDVTVPIRADSDTTVPKAASSATTVPIKNTSATTVPTAASSATTVPIKDASATSCDDITAWNAGSGSASLTFTMDTTDTKKLKIAFSHSHSVPSLSYTARSIIGVQSTTTSVTGVSGSTSIYGVQSSTTSVTGVSGSTTVRGVKTGDNSTTTASKVTLGTAKSIPNVTAATDVTVPIKNSSASTFVTGTTHTITDNGHTHTI